MMKTRGLWGSRLLSIGKLGSWWSEKSVQRACDFLGCSAIPQIFFEIEFTVGFAKTVKV